jgi:hypothetical protein
MDLKIVKKIKLELAIRETADLVEIWCIHDQSSWTVEAFEAIHQILLTRMDDLPSFEDRQLADRLIRSVKRYLGTDDLGGAYESVEPAFSQNP